MIGSETEIKKVDRGTTLLSANITSLTLTLMLVFGMTLNSRSVHYYYKYFPLFSDFVISKLTYKL